ncbi:MAG: hypothetical protein U0353_26485 [Sandaracinus sp.]
MRSTRQRLLSTATFVACALAGACDNSPMPNDASAGDGGSGDHDTDPSGPDASSVGMGADWGFRAMPGGFMFENYTNTPPVTNLTAVEMRRLLGPQVCESATGDCVLVPQAQQWMEQQNAAMNGGHCEGMAVVAALFYSGGLDSTTFGAPDPFALTLVGNEPLQREMAFWYATQATTSIESDLTPRQVVERLERDLAQGRSFAGTVLGVYTSPGRGHGHAVTPYMVRRPSADVAEIVVYDNNFANQEKVVTVNVAADTWSYITSTNPMEMPIDYMGDATTRTLVLADVEPRRATLPHACPFCGDAAMAGAGTRGSTVMLQASGGGALAIRDGSGRVSGIGSDGAMVNGIPGASCRTPRSGLGSDSPSPECTVPREGTLTVTLDGSRLTAPSDSEVLLTGQGFALSVENVQLDPTQQDTITFRTDAPDVQYRASAPETPTLVLAFQGPAEDYLLQLRATGMATGQTLRLSVDLTAQRVHIGFEDSTVAPEIELYMERVSEAGVVSFLHRGVASMPSSKLHIPYAGWAGNGMPLQMEIDDDGDGTIDRMVDLTDED